MANDVPPLLGRRIGEFRRAAGLTQAQLAERLSVALETISRMERGATTPSVKTLERIAQALDVRMQDFFAAEGGPSRKDRLLEGWVSAVRRRRIEDIRFALGIAEAALDALEQRDSARAGSTAKRRPKRRPGRR